MNTNQPPQQNPNPAPQQDPRVQQLESELASLKNYVGEIGPFVQDASYLIAAIAANPQLKDSVAQATNAFKGGQPYTQPQPQQVPTQQPVQQPQNGWKFDPVTGQPINQQPVQQVQHQQPQQPSPQVQGIDVKMREDIITQTEAKLGYNNFTPERKKELRKQVEQRLNSWNTSVTNAPVNQLPKLLEDAYLLTDINKAKEEGRLDGIIEARNSEMGMLPAMGNQQPAPQTTTLTAEQQAWTKRWNLNEDRVTERLKEFKETGVMTYKPKEQVQTPQKPAPSGTPQPPQQAQ